MAGTGQVKFEVSVSAATATAIAAVPIPGEELTPITKCGMIAAGLLDQLAEGGIMLAAEDVERLRDTGAEVQEASDIVEMAEKSMGRKAGQYEFMAALDPMHVQGMRDIAESNGVPLERLATEILQFGLDNDWGYAVPADYRVVRLLPEQYELLKSLTGVEQPNGQDLETLLRHRILGEEESPLAATEEQLEPVPMGTS